MKNKKNRKATFVCSLSYKTNHDKIVSVEGKLKGNISYKITGKKGFGYDPIFIPLNKKITFGQMFKLKKKTELNIILFFSIFALTSAFFIEYILGHKPCNLCLIERFPYIASIIFITLIFIINRFQRLLSVIVLLFFIFGSVVSFYHVGIEQGFFSESLVCDLGNSKNLSKDELLNQLKNSTVVSCKDVTFRLFGLSLATINTIISIILSGIIIKVVKNYGKN